MTTTITIAKLVRGRPKSKDRTPKEYYLMISGAGRKSRAPVTLPRLSCQKEGESDEVADC